MDVEVIKALKQMNDTINDLVRRVDNMANSHYQENAGKIIELKDTEGEQNFRMDRLQDGHDDNADQITDIQELLVEDMYEDILNEYDIDEV